MEHPEDLGITSSGDVPASVWRMTSLRTFVDDHGFAGALYQCGLGAESQKPTRLATNLDLLRPFLKLGWPTFEKD
eukprot:12427581-Karenia_brevis.AAC.1